MFDFASWIFKAPTRFFAAIRRYPLEVCVTMLFIVAVVALSRVPAGGV